MQWTKCNMKDFAKRINSKNSSKKNKSVNQKFITKKSFKNPFSLKTGLTLAIFSALGAFVLISSMNTDVKKIAGLDITSNIEFSYPVGLKEDWIYTEDLDRSNEECNYILQIETYGRKIYAQEELTNILKLGLQPYINNYFSYKEPGKAYYRLMSGPYDSKSAVNNAREILIKSGRSPLIRQRCSKN